VILSEQHSILDLELRKLQWLQRS